MNGKEAHPCLTMTNLALSNVVWPWLQGMQQGRVYFCGSYVTPGNGHDLSMLSGLVVANKIGAKYPFQNNEKSLGRFSSFANVNGYFIFFLLINKYFVCLINIPPLDNTPPADMTTTSLS